jgi:hypothetical protein
MILADITMPVMAGFALPLACHCEEPALAGDAAISRVTVPPTTVSHIHPLISIPAGI